MEGMDKQEYQKQYRESHREYFRKKCLAIYYRKKYGEWYYIGAQRECKVYFHFDGERLYRVIITKKEMDCLAVQKQVEMGKFGKMIKEK